MNVTTESVMDGVRRFIGEAQKDFFTTSEIAACMGVDEYPVRAAMTWLARSRMVEAVPGVRSRRYTRGSGKEYSATVYRLCDRNGAADMATLLRVFCGCRA